LHLRVEDRFLLIAKGKHARTSRSTEGRAETDGASRLVGCLLSARLEY
jgi:hypothetical protein